MNQAKAQKSNSAIALYYYTLSGTGGGAERRVCALASNLTHYYDVHLITWDADDAQSFYPLPSSVTWHRLGFANGLLDKFRRVGSLKRVLKENQISKLIGFVMSNDKVVFLAGLLSGASIIAAERNGPTLFQIRYGFLARWLIFLSLTLCKRIVLQFEDFASGYPKFLHSRMTVIHNPIELAEQLASPGNAKKQRFEILFVGRLDGLQKRPEMLIKAFSHVAETYPDWDLKITKDSSPSPGLTAIVRDLKLETRVRFIPPTSDVSSLYQNADLLVIPSLWEGFPNVLAEAMAHGLPCIGFSVDGVKQLIQHDVTGWLVTGDDERALAKKMALAMANPERLANIGAAAHQAALRYSPEDIYNQWHAMLAPEKGCIRG
jgi:glycosyltransferase involved in cell wall biosynthesis